MSVLIVAPFCSLPGEPYFNRFLFVANALSKRTNVELVTSRFRHFDKKHRDFVNKYSFPYPIHLIDEPGYNHNVSIGRFLSHAIFVLRFIAWFMNNTKKNKYEYVYSAYPLATTNIFLSFMKKFYGYKLVVDVQDIWPDSVGCAFPIVNKHKFLLSPFRMYCNFAFTTADAIFAVSNTYLNFATRVNPTAFSKVVYIGSSLSTIRTITPNQYFTDKFNIVYLGSMTHSYDLLSFIKSIYEDKFLSKYFCLHLLGDGPDLSHLKSYESDSIKFYGMVDYSQAVSYAKSADYLLNPIRDSAQQSITNKLSDYILLAVPIINSQSTEEALNIISKVPHINYKSDSVQSARNVLYKLYHYPLKTKHLNEDLVNKFDRDVAYSTIINLLSPGLYSN